MTDSCREKFVTQPGKMLTRKKVLLSGGVAAVSSLLSTVINPQAADASSATSPSSGSIVSNLAINLTYQSQTEPAASAKAQPALTVTMADSVRVTSDKPTASDLKYYSQAWVYSIQKPSACGVDEAGHVHAAKGDNIIYVIVGIRKQVVPCPKH